MPIGQGSRKAIAATLFLIFFTETFAPSMSYALSSGPTLPEVTSFEPVDTTDMVNLLSGDFTYNLPLLEVPGPEGGYPLSLSYHAGISPNQDASWVGLGWTLNPGGISRSVNGIPDDWFAAPNSSHVYWSGGSQDVFNAGVNIGIAQSPFSASFGLTVAHDTYKGFSAGLSYGLGGSGPNGWGAHIGSNFEPFSAKRSLSYGVSQSASIGRGLSVSAGVNESTNFHSVQRTAYATLGLGGSSLLGATIGSDGNTSYSYGAGGFSSTVSSSKAAGIETSTQGLNLSVPITSGFSVNLGYTKTRYWTDETTSQVLAGSLNPNSGGGTSGGYDVVSLLDDPDARNIAAYPDPTTLQGGTYPAYDDYNVMAQGLGGNMSPINFQQGLLTQSHKDNSNNPTVTSYFAPSDLVLYAPSGFRFQNDFSNSYRQTYGPYTDFSQAATTAAPPFDPSAAYGNSDGTYGAFLWTTEAHPERNPILEGSRHIDVGVSVLPSNTQGYTETDRYRSHMIKGFSITNESGVTYHFGLPAYSYGEQTYQEKIDRSNGLYFNRATRPVGYAYTWYLTSITGPDFVDRDGDSKAGPNDWGYWVNFEYGKWSNRYAWRNPSEGYARDEDNAFQNVAMGYKEVYYLNAIRTRSHVALFEKTLRKDGKGSTPAIFNTNAGGPNNAGLDYTSAGSFDTNSSQSLALSHIYLLNASDGALVTPSSNPSTTAFSPTRTIPCTDCELPVNTLMDNDVDYAGRALLESKAVRIIDMSYDYSLCPGTSNSFDILTGGTGLSGKLTLNYIVSRGKGGISLIPPTSFAYDLSGSDIVTQTGVTLSPTNFTTSNAGFNVGDMIATIGNITTASVFCGTIISKSPPSGGIYTYTLSNNNYSGGATTVDVHTTKNPGYNKDLYDAWGMYKGDGNISTITNNENLGRNTTPASAKTVDAWCLRKIISPLGDAVKVNYESDVYHTSAMNSKYSYVMQNISVAADKKTLTFTLASYGSIADQGLSISNGQFFPNILLAVDYVGAGSACSGVIRYSYSSNLGGLTVSSVTTSGSVTTITGVLTNAIPALCCSGGTYVGIPTGNIWINTTGDFLGGGLRVNSVTSTNSMDNTSSSLVYNYNNPSGVSSGITSYTPATLDAYDGAAMSATGGQNMCYQSDYLVYYKTQLYKNASGIYPIARELPPPGVMYQYVTVKSQVKNPDEASLRNIEGSTQYQFEVFNTNFVARKELNAIQSWSSINYARNWIIRKFTSAIGKMKSVTQYDNNGVMLSQTINHYLHDDLESANLSSDDFFDAYKTLIQQNVNYQGFFQERYLDIKNVSSYIKNYAPPQFYAGAPTLWGNRATLSGRETYPCIQTGQTIINYVNGTQSSSTNLSYDYYSGQVTSTLTTDIYGNNFKTETVPAFRVSQYGAMGLKINTPTNKHMLTQAAGSSTWKVDGSNTKLGLVAASATTWSDIIPATDMGGTSYTQNTNTVGGAGDVWRQQSTYNWMPATQTTDGLTPLASFTDLNRANPPASDPGWKSSSTITRYDVYSKPLESIDINGNYSATRMDYGDKKVILTGGPANFNEIAYSGAEDLGGSQSNAMFVKSGNGTIVNTAGSAHTGKQGLLLGVSGQKGFTYSVQTTSLLVGRTYQASVWIKPTTGSTSSVGLYYDIDGGTPKPGGSSSTSVKTANGWTLVNMIISGADITTGTHTLNVWCRNDHASIQAYADDFRFQPLNASTTAYVYDPVTGELTYTLDNSNIFTGYTYDAVGRLTAVNKEKIGVGVFKVSDYAYNYSSPKFLSAYINGTFTRNDCGIGYLGSNVSITIPAGAYASYTNQLDADAQATNAGQLMANQQGSCTVVESIPISIQANMLVTVTFKQGSTVVAEQTFSNTGGTMYVPPGTYTVIVLQKNGVSHNVTITGYTTQTGTTATFTNVTLPVTVTVN